ncbi:hypothetical protein Tco_0459168 [Tanacetum coccineum]
MESIRRNFFNGVQCDERKIVWIKWAKVLASKKYGGLGVSSFYALNRALLFKWVWRFLSRDNSCGVSIMSMHGLLIFNLSRFSLLDLEIHLFGRCIMLKDRGVGPDVLTVLFAVGNGLCTQFWNEVWIGDTQLRVMFPRIYALEINKDYGVWDLDLNGEGVFRVKDVSIILMNVSAESTDCSLDGRFIALVLQLRLGYGYRQARLPLCLSWNLILDALGSYA